MPAPKTWYFYAQYISDGTGWAYIKDGGSPPTGQTFSSAWDVGTALANTQARLAFGSTRPQTAFAALAQPSGVPTYIGSNSTLATGFRTVAPLTGVFDAGTWTFNLAAIATVEAGQTGRYRFRVWAGTDPTAAGARELTAGIVVGSTITVGLVQGDCVASVVLPLITLTNEYVWIDIAWEIINPATDPAADVHMRRDGAFSKVVTPNWTTSFNVLRKVVAGDGTGDYLTIQAALNALYLTYFDLTPGASNLILELEVHASASQTMAPVIEGAIVQQFITDANHFIRIFVANGEHHRGKWDESKFTLKTQNIRGIRVVCNFVRIEGFQVQVTTTAAILVATNAFHVSTALTSPGAYDIRFINCLAKGVGGQGNAAVFQQMHGFQGSSQDAGGAGVIGTIQYINCIAEDFIDYSNPEGGVPAGASIPQCFGFNTNTIAADNVTHTRYLYYNCEVRRCFRGIRVRSYSVIKNYRGVDNEDSVTLTSGPTAGYTATNTSSKKQNTAPDKLGADGRDGVMGMMVDPLGDDWTPTTSDNQWNGRGTNLSADIYASFDWDASADQAADGTGYVSNRPGSENVAIPWTIGALESVVGGDPQDVEWVWVGNVTDISATLKIRLSKAIESPSIAYLILSKSADLSNPILPSMQSSAPASNDQICVFNLLALSPRTTYYYAVQVNGKTYSAFNRSGKFRTFPPVGQAANLTLVFASCMAGGTGQHTLMDNIVALDPDIFCHLGDFHYNDINTAVVADHLAPMDQFVLRTPTWQKLMRNVPLAYLWSDHDYCGDNTTQVAVGRAAAQAAFRVYTPHYPFGNTNPLDNPIYQSFVIGRVRIIMTDMRSFRPSTVIPDDANKSMMGTLQKAWFKQQCLDARTANQLIIWMNEVCWNEAPTFGSDAWGGYTTERKELEDFWVAERITNMIKVEGDTHSGALDSGANDKLDSSGTGPGHILLRNSPMGQIGQIANGTFDLSPDQWLLRTDFGLVQIADEDGEFLTATVSLLDTNSKVLATITRKYNLATPIAPTSGAETFPVAQSVVVTDLGVGQHVAYTDLPL